MTRDEFRRFLSGLQPMNGHGDKKAINANYKALLDAGFRCNRKLHCYEDEDGNRTIWVRCSDGLTRWLKLYTSGDLKQTPKSMTQTA